jgi:DNA-binding protein H-NS
MSKTPNDESLSLEELQAAQAELEAKIQARLAENRKQAIENIMQLIKDNNLDPREVADTLNAKARRKKAPALYRSPDNPRQTWSGVGTPPAWYEQAPDKQALRIRK